VGGGVSSLKRIGRFTTFGLAVGAGLLIASGAGAAVAAAAPGSSAGGSSASSESSGAAHRAASVAGRSVASSSAAVKSKSKVTPKASSKPAPVVALSAVRHARGGGGGVSPAGVVVPARALAAVPAVSTKQVLVQRVPAVPAPVQLQQVIVAALDTVRRDFDNLRRNIVLLVQHQIEGFQYGVAALRTDLERIFNIGKPIIYGNLANAQYWAAQGAQTSNLMSVAMVIGQLKHETVTAQDIVDEAMSTDSVARPGQKMYLGTDANDWTWAADAVQLLENHGIKVTQTYYTKSQGQRALGSIETALRQGKSVIVSIVGSVVTTGDATQQVWTVEHSAVLLGINVTKDLVYLNDGALPQGGQNVTMSLEDFMDAWQGSRYTAITAELAPPTAQGVTVKASQLASVAA
jgi:hypothetical protein